MIEELPKLKFWFGPDQEILMENLDGNAPAVLRDALGQTLRIGDRVAVSVCSGRSSAEQAFAKITEVRAYVAYVRVMLESAEGMRWYAQVKYRVPKRDGRMVEVINLTPRSSP
jgi:hypothetical protein